MGLSSLSWNPFVGWQRETTMYQESRRAMFGFPERTHLNQASDASDLRRFWLSFQARAKLMESWNGLSKKQRPLLAPGAGTRRLLKGFPQSWRFWSSEWSMSSFFAGSPATLDGTPS